MVEDDKKTSSVDCLPLKKSLIGLVLAGYYKCCRHKSSRFII